jgi:hypothetical protein
VDEGDRQLDENLQGVARIVSDALRVRVPDEVARRHEAMLRASATSGGDVRVLAGRGRSSRRAGRRLAIAALAAAMVVGSGAVAFAADGAVPGDALYGVDRALEHVQDAMARDPESKANTQLSHAAERLHELQALRDDEDIAEAAREAAEHDAHAVAQAKRVRGRDGDAVRAHVLAMIAKHVARLRDVQDRLAASGHASDRAVEALQHAIDNGSKAAGKVQHGRGTGSSQAPTASPTAAPGSSGEHRQDGAGQGGAGSPDGNQGGGGGNPAQGQGGPPATTGPGNQGQSHGRNTPRGN